MKHKWSKEIHAIADGIDVQRSLDNGIRWEDFDHEIHMSPIESKNSIWRIKPEVPQCRKDMAQALKDGKEVQFYIDGKWMKAETTIEQFLNSNVFLHERLYRIKPEPKPDVVRYITVTDSERYRVHQIGSDNLKLIWDGETGVFKGAKVLS